MKRLLLFPVVSVAVAVFASAQESAPPGSDKPRIQQLQRDQWLVKELVHGGLKLAGPGTALHRADCVQEMAEVFADEIEKAARNKDGDRAKELGKHLKTLLTDGIAPNLSAVRSVSTPDSAMNPDLVILGKRVADKLQPLEQKLQEFRQTDQDDIDQTLVAVQEGHKAVDNALRVQALRKQP